MHCVKRLARSELDRHLNGKTRALTWLNRVQADLVFGTVGRPHPWLHAVERAVFKFCPDHHSISRRGGVGILQNPNGDVFIAILRAECRQFVMQLGVDPITVFVGAKAAMLIKWFDWNQSAVLCMRIACFSWNFEAVVAACATFAPWQREIKVVSRRP